MERFFQISLLIFSWLIAGCSYFAAGDLDPNFHPGFTVSSGGADGSGGSGGSGGSDPAPTITSLNTTVGPTGGGTSVTITGTGFLSGAAVTFGGASGTSVSVVSSTSITVTTPAHAAGAVNVVVTNTDAQSGTLTNGFTYQAAPTVTSLNITAGALSGSTNVTITGTGFLAGATVTFGGASGTSVSIVSSTSITVTTPAHVAGAVNVVVTNTDSQSGTLTNGYTYQAAPTLTSLDIISGTASGGTNITLTGSGFLAGATVTFGGSSGTAVSVVSTTNITVTTPGHAAGAVNVVVTNTDGQSATLTNGYTFNLVSPAPTVTSLSVSGGPLAGGQSVTITGADFVSGATVSFGGVGVTSAVVVNATTINVVTATRAAATVDVVVTNPDTQSGTLTNGYTYRPAPTVTSLSIGGGGTVGGTSVTITGTGFVTGATVTFGGNSATSVSFVNSTSITCVSPAHAAGTVDVVVTNSDAQLGTLTNSFSYALSLAPTVSGATPGYGPTWGGTLITITGTNFAAGATVTFGGVSGTSVNVANATTITVLTPAGSYTGTLLDIVVANADTQSATLSSAFIYGSQNIFVSSTTYTGDMSGLAGADFRCQVAAVNAGLSGTWKALLSDNITSASSRISYTSAYVLNRRPNASGGPQQVTDVNGLWQSNSFAWTNSIHYDENGTALNVNAWTGSSDTGATVPGGNCTDWSMPMLGNNANAGSSTATSNLFTGAGTKTCDTSQHLFCMDGQSAGAAPSANPTLTNTAVGTDQATFTFAAGAGGTGGFRLVYTTGGTAPANCTLGTIINAYTIGVSSHYTVTGLSSGTQYSFRLCATNSTDTAYTTGVTATITTPTVDQRIFLSNAVFSGDINGRYGANLMCQIEASNAGLSGTWKAMLSGPGLPISTQLSFNQPLYDMQSPKVLISRDSVDFFANVYGTSIQYGADGTNIGSVNVWTGSTAAGADSIDSCLNWVDDTSPAINGTLGLSSSTGSALLNNGSLACSGSAHLYCTNQQSSSAAPSNPATFANPSTGTDRATFTFSSGGGTTAGFRLAYTTGGTAPANCLSGTQISALTIGLDYSWVVTGLSPGTQYSFRLCASNSDETAFSAGSTLTLTTATSDYYAFVTGSPYAPNFGSAAAADGYCQTEATTAGLSGTWKAIVSGAAVNTSSRITIDKPVYDMQNNLIANNALEFWGGAFSKGITYGPNGANIGTVVVWTGTNADGTWSANNCVNWSSNGAGMSSVYGTSNKTDGTLINNGTSPCSSSWRLYCISQ